MDIKKTYLDFLQNDDEMTMPVAAISALVALLAKAQPSTSAELIEVLQQASRSLKQGFANSISLSAGCDLFLRFVLRNINEYKDWDACRRNLVENGRLFAERAKESRSRIARLGSEMLVRDDDVILVHGRSRVVNALLALAARSRSGSARFHVYVTEARVGNEGIITAQVLRSHNIPVTLIPDVAVAYVIDKCDKVFLGAEGVAESGGVINHIGTCQVAMLAHAAHKPVYVLAESHKFVRLFPLGPSDLPGNSTIGKAWDSQNRNTTASESNSDSKTIDNGYANDDPRSWPQVDFTPHHYITALVTDLGVLTPAAVSEELIKIWFD